MTDSIQPDTTNSETRSSIFQEVIGKNQFDDRIDTQSDLTTWEALQVIGRSLRQITAEKRLFGAKVVLELGLIIPGLYLPWLGKIVIDNVIQQRPFNTTEIEFPPFMQPVLNIVQDQDPLQIMFSITIITIFGMILLGMRTYGLGAGLHAGQDAATQAENQISASYSNGSGLLGLVAFMVGVRLTQRLANRLRTRLFERLSRMPMSVLDDQRIGDSIYRVMYDVPMAPDLFLQLTIVPFLMMLNAGISLYVLQYSYGDVSPELIWIAWATVPAAFIITFPFSGAVRRTSQNKRAAGSATTNAMEESVSNVAAVQSLGATDEQSTRFADRSEQSFLRERYYIAVVIACSCIFAAVSGLAGIYVLILVSDRIIDGVMSPGDYAVLIGVFYSIATPAGYLGAYWIKIQDVIAAVRRVFFFMDYESEEDYKGGDECTAIEREISFEGVGYTYPNGTRALIDIDLSFKFGDVVAIVGPTGSGKTTLAYLIPSILQPSDGRVLIDGRDAREFDVESIRQRVSYVLQEHTFLSATIRHNLLLANPKATDAQMFQALETAGCMEFISELPSGVDTRLGRGGDTLSVGQQQRLSIARGLIRESQVLILDEPTAALDPQTEQTLLNSLRRAAENRLVVVIAHRLSTIRQADQIVFIEEGRIQEIGTHDELISRPTSSYREYVELQRVTS
ncbi:MAG: ABC transporter ATP-binding protein [Gammaproteobacteria bacterium]|nr:ABC transporter ATP-binding protein [Gammaproteobacteria bacterium]